VLYRLGTGIGEVTDPAVGLPLMGMADPRQTATGVESRLYARAFLVAEPSTAAGAHRIAIIVADIWAGTRRLKEPLLERMAASYGERYTDANVLLAGTHTHSAPAGYSGTRLYDYTAGGCDQAVVECIVDGCMRALEMAHANLAPGRIYVNRGEVQGCGGNRSAEAYLRNPEHERESYGSDTDREMLLLKFVKVSRNGRERPVGALSWYAIHPTDRGQKNTLVTGDNKGHASQLFEQSMGTQFGQRETFVAAFANANCGDVSGNVELGHIPDGVTDRERMEKHGRLQFEVADRLFQTASQEVTGPLDYRHTRVDFSSVKVGDNGARTWPAALGLSFAAGSSEDSVPVPSVGIREGITVDTVRRLDPELIRGTRTVLSKVLGISLAAQSHALQEHEGHHPKPVVLMPGIAADPAVPQVLPVQLLRIGSVAILGIPGELTTMAGRRLRNAVLDTTRPAGATHVALATYANEYAQYITTREEYGAQHYEGASTLFGPHTLAAFQQVATALARNMVAGTPSAPGPPPTPWSAPPHRRFRFRNLSKTAVKLSVYNPSDRVHMLKLPNGEKTIEAQSEIAYPEREFTGFGMPTIRDVGLRARDGTWYTMSAGQLMTISINGSISVGAYVPPARAPSER
jgi:neutral ceramidase